MHHYRAMLWIMAFYPPDQQDTCPSLIPFFPYLPFFSSPLLLASPPLPFPSILQMEPGGLGKRCTVSRVARSPVFSGSSRISASISRLPDRSQNLPYLTRRSLASDINVLETFCSLLIVHSTIYIARQHTDARY